MRIAGRRMETADIVALTLADPNGADLPGFTAGAHIDVEIQPGLVRQYSLMALPNAGGTYQIGVLKDPASRGGSVALHALRQDDHIRISAPRNHFSLAAGDHPTLLFAGGIGVTPLMCMAEELHRAGRPFKLHYCARSASRAAFVDLLQTAPYADRVELHFDDGDASDKLGLDALLTATDRRAHLYVCGPAGFMEWVIGAALGAGWPDAQIHREYFKADPPVVLADDGVFQVRLAKTGREFRVPADRSIAAVLIGAGVDVPLSCEAGVCGTCLCTVLDGVPDHRDYFLTPDEKARGNQILPCCSRAKTPLLVLDL